MSVSQPAVAPLRIVRDPEQAQTELQRLASRTTQTQQGEARERVDAILAAVRDRGDAAIAEFTERFDGFLPEPMAVPQDALEQAWSTLPTNLRDAL